MESRRKFLAKAGAASATLAAPQIVSATVTPAFGAVASSAVTSTMTTAGTISAPGWSAGGANAASIGGGCTFPDSNGRQITLTNWGFAIPALATICGISVTAQGASTAGTNSLQLVKAGAVAGAAEPLSISGGSCPGSSDTVGGVSDLWGTTLTPADVNDVGFGVRYVAQFGGRQFDGASVTVHYNP